MKKTVFLFLVLTFFLNNKTIAQDVKFGKYTLTPVNTSLSFVKMEEKDAIMIKQNTDEKGSNLPTYAKISNIDFLNGAIELKVYSTLLKDAPPFARGFIGVAFHINDDDNSKFECIYLRPTNARADDQLRRNHSIQYCSLPDYGWYRLRIESPAKYESYTDITLNEWIDMKIMIDGATAKLYLKNNKQPALIVNDLKLGNNSSGAIGLFVDIGTEGYFSDIKITEK